MFLVVLSTLFIAYLVHELYWKRRNFPPGPTPLPLVGNLLSLNFPPPGYEAFNRWSKEYGGCYTFWLGSVPYVMVSSYSLLKETFIRDGDNYVNKKSQGFQTEFRGGAYGVVETNGDIWRDHRRFALTNLRDFGLGKDLMQEKILIEVQEVFKKFDEHLDEDVKVTEKFDNGVANVINQLTFGYRFDEEHQEEFKNLMDIVDYQTEAFSDFKILVLMSVPWLNNVLPKPNLDDLLRVFQEKFYTFFDSQIEKHRKKIDFDAVENSDYVEAYLKEQKKREEGGDSESYSNKQLSNMCLDLWFAGLTTTTTTISWALAYILNNLEVQEKIHEELDRVIGSDSLITTSGKNNLPYMNAVINEAQRCSNILPLNLLHEVTRDTTINGYPVKQGTGVVAQISTVMMDENVFTDPKKFNPDRFIDETGKLKRIEELVPFSVGKRQCLGEGLARMELFLFISNFFNRYEIKPSTERGIPSLDKTGSLAITPQVITVVLTKRYQ